MALTHFVLGHALTCACGAAIDSTALDTEYVEPREHCAGCYDALVMRVRAIGAGRTIAAGVEVRTSR